MSSAADSLELVIAQATTRGRAGLLGWLARWLGMSAQSFDSLLEGIRSRHRQLAFVAQLVPTMRLIAPGIAGFMRTDLHFFLRSFLRAPSRVGAIAPSGASLTRLITSEIRRDRGPVIELGPGTGVFTRALVASGIPEADLVLVEQGGEFAVALRSRFPAAQVLAMDAAKLHGLELLDGRKAGSAISGLPLRTMSPLKIMAILRATFDRLRPDAGFYQFTYGLGCPVPRPILDRLGLEAARVGTAFANLPPASVYCIRRRVLRHAPEIVSQRQLNDWITQ